MFHQNYFKMVIVQEGTLDYFFSLFEKAKQVFFDTETTGLSVRHPGKDYVVGYTFAFEDDVSKDVFYIPVRHVFEGKFERGTRFKALTSDFLKNFPNFRPENFEGEYYNVDAYDFAQKLKSIMESGGKEYIAHNISYDLHVIANEGIDMLEVFDKNIIQDTQVMVHTIDENVEKNLEAVTEMLFNVKKSHYSDTIKTVTKEEKLSQGMKATVNAGFQHVQIPVGGQYSSEDVWFMKQMYPKLIQGLHEDEQYDIYIDYRIPFLKVLWKMERKGVRIDIEALDKMQKIAEEEAENFKYRMFYLVGMEFNPDSSQNLYELLFGFNKQTVSLSAEAQVAYEAECANLSTRDKLKAKKAYMRNRQNVRFTKVGNQSLIERNFGFTPIEWTDGGEYGYEELKTPKTGKEVLKALSKQDVSDEAKQFLKELVEYKKLSKLISAFMIGLREQIYEDGKVHCSFNICGCLVGDTLIPTSDGIIPIKDIKKGMLDSIPYPLEKQIVNKDLSWENTKYIIKYIDKDTTKLSLALGMEIEGSNIHPIVVSKYHSVKNNSRFKRLKGTSENECWKALQDIEVGEHIVVPYGYNKFSDTYQTLTYEVPNLTSHCKKDITLPSVLTEDVAEFLGMYYADGCIKDNNGSFTLNFTNGNRDVVERLRTLSTDLFGITANVYSKPTTCSLDITAKALYPIEKAMELKRGCVNKVIPNLVLKSPCSVVKAFIRGMTLDSCVVKNPDKVFLKFTVSNRLSAKYLQELLLNIGIVSSVRQDKSKTKNVFHVSIYNEWYEKFRDEIGFIESEKAVECTFNNFNKHNGYIVFKDRLYVRVVGKEYRKADVYDFNVPDTHSFLSLPCISHNTDSWRLSSACPNLQQLPKPLEEPKEGEDRSYYDFWSRFEIRKLMVADEGYQVVASDYHALEKFLTAHLSQDEVLIKMMRENLDPHGTVATLVFPDLKDVHPNQVKKVAPDKRQIAKTVGFALDYGGGAGTIARNLKIDIKTAQKYVDNYFEGFNGLHLYDKAVVRFAKANGYVKTLGGHKRHLWDINSEDRGIASYNERVAVNVLSQGAGADVAMFAQIDIDNDPILNAIGAYMVVNVHDEIIMMCPKEYVELCKERLVYNMEKCLEKRGINLTIPLEAVADSGDNYAAAK